MKPVLCNYYVTYRCNAKCGFCDIWEQPSPMIAIEDARRNRDHADQRARQFPRQRQRHRGHGPLGGRVVDAAGYAAGLGSD